MDTQFFKKKRRQEAYALATVMVIGGISIGLFASAARWTESSSVLNDRHNTYNSAVAAAEGATELVLSYLDRDFVNQSYDPANLIAYQNLVPTNDWAAAYQFSDGAGGVNRTFVTGSSTNVMTSLSGQFAGLYGLAYNCSVRANARPVGPYDMAAAVDQELQLASIPVFQFAIFYGMTLEINPGPAMKITGKVHSNADIYTCPGATLEYADTVTAVGDIHNGSRAPGDPTAPSGKMPTYDMTNQPTPHASSLTLPVGTNNSPAAVRSIVEVPPFNEDPNSPEGKQRYYNNADLVVTVTPTNAIVQTGQWDGFKDVTPDVGVGTNASYSFVTTNDSFYDAREQKNTMLTDLNVGFMNKWMTNTATSGGSSLNNRVLATLGHPINSVYVNDERVKSGNLTVVRVSNGQQLPPGGLTVATALPLYVKGSFNAPVTTPGYTNTSNTLPASLVGDSITVLSQSWQDYINNTKSVTQRPATDTTVNAAFMAGIVQTATVGKVGHYSGGVENFPRFLEDWGSSGKTFTYNGSMVVMFPSQYATNWWNDPGTGSANYYNAPTRKWAFDVNFLDYRKLPPATPMVRQLIRGQWIVVAAR